MEKQFLAFDKRVGAMSKDAEKTAVCLAKAAGIAGLNGVITGETITAQEAKLQAQIDSGKQLIKDVITENSETRRLIDDREKAEKVMHSKESTAEKAEKKSDEKAPQYRDEATKAAEDFKMLDSQLMDRLRKWNQTKGEVFQRVYLVMSDVLTAPNSVGGGSGGGGGGGGGLSISKPPAVAVAPAASAPIPASVSVGVSRAVVQPLPADLSGWSMDKLEDNLKRINDQLAKCKKEKDELEKLAAMYKKDPEAAGKATSEAMSLQEDIAVLESDRNRIQAAMSQLGSAAAAAPVMSPVAGKEKRAIALYDFAAEREEELSLKAGDVVVVIDDTDTEGWWEGVLGGVSGFFPGSYVRLEE